MKGRGIGHLFNHLLPNVGLEDFGDDDAAIGLLVVFHNGNHDPGQGQPGAVQGVDKLGLSLRGGAVANVSPSGLKIATVGAGAYLQPLITAGSPHFNVIGLGGSKA